MPELIINRSSDFLNKYRDIKILVDGTSVGIAIDGETKVFDIPAGAHTIKAKMDWRGSAEHKFTVQKGDKITFRLSGFKGQKIIITLSTVAVLSTFLLPQVSEAYIRTAILIITVGCVVGFMAYIYTLGRNRYLTLTQE